MRVVSQPTMMKVPSPCRRGTKREKKKKKKTAQVTNTANAPVYIQHASCSPTTETKLILNTKIEAKVREIDEKISREISTPVVPCTPEPSKR